MRSRVLAVCTLAAGVTLVVLAPGSPAVAARGRTLSVVPIVSAGESPPLRLLHASPNAKGVWHGEDEEQPIRHGRVVSGPTDAATTQTQAGTSAAVSSAASFEGQSNADGVVPPDTNGDIGPNNYVQWVNLHLVVFDRSGNKLMSVPGNQIFAGLGSNNPCSYDNDGDPVVQYDQFHNRWVLTQFAFDDFLGVPFPPFGQCVAVSKTSDPTGGYWLYSWDTGAAGGGSDNFPDYPKLGIWPDGYYMSFNYFSSDLSTFLGSGIMIMDSAKMVNGDPSAAALATGPIGSQYGGLLPPDIDGPNVPPAGTPATFAAFDTEKSTNTLQFWHTTVNWSGPSATFGGPGWAPDATLTVPAYDWNLCGGSRDCIPQPGTTQKLDPLSDRLMYRAAYRYFPSDGHEAMVLTHTVDVDPTSATHAGVRWYEVRQVSTTPTLQQSGTYAPDGNNRWMPSIAMDKAGDIGLGYSVAGTSTYPSIRWTGQTSGATGMNVAEGSITAGSGSQTGYNRWGDYSALTVDPVDDCTFWYTNEYYGSSSSYGWQTRVGWFRISDCSGAPPPPAPPTPTNVTAALSPGTTNAIDVTWTAATGATGYSIRRSADGGSTWPFSTTTASTAYHDGSLAAGTYVYQVAAYDTGGSSAWSASTAPITISPPPAPPGAFTLSAKATSKSTIALSWTASSGAASYTAWRRRGSSGSFTVVSACNTVTSTSCSDSGLSAGTTYYYYVIATNPAGSTKSNTVNVRTPKR